MPSTPVKKQRNVQQKRSLDSQRKLLAAAEKLFAEKGFARTKVSDIIELSGCSIGSFYHQFTDKHGIFDVLYQEYIDNSLAALEETSVTMQTQPRIEDALHVACDTALKTLINHVGARLAAEELIYDQSHTRDSANMITDRFITQMNKLIPIYTNQIGHPNPLEAMENAVQVIAMVLTNQTLRPTSHLPKDHEQLIQIMIASACGILQVKK